MTGTCLTTGPRLAPAERRRHLIDTARAIVIDDGTAALTMERLATRAGVSRGLAYTYFGNRAGLVRELWADVAHEWAGDPMPEIPSDATHDELRRLFDERLDVTTAWYVDMIERGGVLLHRLMADPDLDESARSFRRRLGGVNVAWWAQLAERLGVPEAEATVFSTMFNGATSALWELVAERVVDRDVVERVFVAGVRAAFADLLAKVATP